MSQSQSKEKPERPITPRRDWSTDGFIWISPVDAMVKIEPEANCSLMLALPPYELLLPEVFCGFVLLWVLGLDDGVDVVEIGLLEGVGVG